MRTADGVVLYRSTAPGRAALIAVGEILGALRLRPHPDKQTAVDFREGREGADFPGCHFRARMSGHLREQPRIVRYGLHRWPSQQATKQLREKICARTGSGPVREDIREVIAALNAAARLRELLPRGDRVMAQRARALQVPRHHPLSEDSATMAGRSSVSSMRENRTYGLKGGWGNGPAQAPRP